MSFKIYVLIKVDDYKQSDGLGIRRMVLNMYIKVQKIVWEQKMGLTLTLGSIGGLLNLTFFNSSDNQFKQSG